MKNLFTLISISDERKGLKNDEVINVVLPFLKHLIDLHQRGLVFDWHKEDAFLPSENSILFNPNAFLTISKNSLKLVGIKTETSANFDIQDEYYEEIKTGSGETETSNSKIQLDENKKITNPVYLLNYYSFEEKLNYRDPKSDIFMFGLIFSSLVIGMDYRKQYDLDYFVNYHNELHKLKLDIHPVFANVITNSTLLNRKKRSQDLSEILVKLENYKTYNPEDAQDLTKSLYFKSLDISNRKDWILTELKSRLFDLSKRNKLLYFKRSMKFVNLTQSSFPIVLDHKSINPKQLFTYSPEMVRNLKVDVDLSLNKYIQINDYPFLVGHLNKIRSEARKDIQEFGFSQLKLVPVFLKWYNIKEDKDKQINSPLLLIPVEIRKKRGIKDHYIINSTSEQAQVNPLLAFYLKELYNIDLPDFIDNNYDAIVDLHIHLEHQIAKNNSGIKLGFLNKPQLKFIHKQATKTLTAYNKRRGIKNKTKSKPDYSYDPKEYQPLGIQMFRSKVLPREHNLEQTINFDQKSNNFTETKTAKTSYYSVNQSNGITPYNWGFDLCDVVIGNFNYKKMSLVRDYNEILRDQLESPIFETLFSDEPKQIFKPESKADYTKDVIPVINADASQIEAVALSQDRSGPDSFIIQGPPGTGKSQTITNLIANAVAHNKNVLFVCEKRAAIDVVFHRLKQKQLGDFCAQIHDSQSDKKAFIHNLRDIYNEQVNKEYSLNKIEKQREDCIQSIQTILSEIKSYHSILKEKKEHAGVSFRELLNSLLDIESNLDKTNESLQQIPEHKHWVIHKKLIRELYELLKGINYKTFSEHSLSLFNLQTFNQDTPQIEIPKSVRNITTDLANLMAKLNKINLFENSPLYLTETTEIIEAAKKISVLLTNPTNLELFKKNSRTFIEFTKQLEQWISINDDLENQLEKNTNWTNKLNSTDAKNALESIQDYEQNFFSFLFPGFWKLKTILKKNYDFSKHQVKPKFSQILDNLCTEYVLISAQSKLQKTHSKLYGFDSIEKINEKLEAIELEFEKTAFFDKLTKSESSQQDIQTLIRLEDSLGTITENLKNLTFGYKSKSISEITEHLEKASAGLIHLPTLGPILKEFSQLPGGFKHWIADNPLSLKQIESLTALQSVKKIYENNLWLKTMNFGQFKRQIKHLKELNSQLLDLNTEFIQTKIKCNFKQNLLWSEIKDKNDSKIEKELKKTYKSGRKIIEHEFSKKMRYKSIRDLITKDSSEIIRDLKPIWMMSPLSVADTLPIDQNLFDLVIFDEASQINLEEGISPIFRGKKTIVVGDQMQMPPTNFFSSNIQSNTEDEDDESELNYVHLDADSLLSQADRKMHSVLLNWHYRSKREALISFSNAAFYNRKLNTIPDVNTFIQDHPKIENTPQFTDFDALNFLDRSISYHKLNQSPYINRSNEGEAEYIAKLVRYIMNNHPEKTIGVVAFSQQQQQTIETALENLTDSDPDFEKALEEEFQRTEEDQFVGLFVKNLENVQGDERDIMILSICYGYNENSKMYMNFGPINRSGGEKRLNVIFSRAKQHMAVISSIYHNDITNDYNEGARYFKNYLHYAQSISEGQNDQAQDVLNRLTSIKNENEKEDSILASQIITALEQKGFIAESNIGHSAFTCDIGIKKKASDTAYSLGICIDKLDFYRSNNIYEQYIHKQNILQIFGWEIETIYAKEWLDNKEECLDRIIKKLEHLE